MNKITKTASAFICAGFTPALFGETPDSIKARLLENCELAIGDMPELERAMLHVQANKVLNDAVFKLASGYSAALASAAGEDYFAKKAELSKGLERDIIGLLGDKIRKDIDRAVAKNRSNIESLLRGGVQYGGDASDIKSDILLKVVGDVTGKIAEERNLGTIKNESVIQGGLVEKHASDFYLFQKIREHLKADRGALRKKGYFQYAKADGSAEKIPTREYKFLFAKKEIWEKDAGTKKYKHSINSLSEKFRKELENNPTPTNGQILRNLGGRLPKMIEGMRKGWEQIGAEKENFLRSLAQAQEADDGDFPR